VDEAQSGGQLSLGPAASAARAEVACAEQEPVLVAPDGRVIDAEAITQAVEGAQARLAEQALRRAQRLEQVRLWRAGR
jgi:hypothetical protein